jgi:hypothetical protein
MRADVAAIVRALYVTKTFGESKNYVAVAVRIDDLNALLEHVDPLGALRPDNPTPDQTTLPLVG